MADPERTAAIEGSIARTLRFAADELSSSPDRTASKLDQARTQLNASDAKEHLSAESIAKFTAQIADLQKQVEDAERKEKADRIERDVKRFLSNLSDEIQSNGSQIDSYFDRAETRLTKDDARDALSAESMAAFRAQLAELSVKAGRGAPATPPAPPPAAPTPVPSVAPQPVAAAPAPVPPSSAPAVAEESEEAQRIKSSITRTLRLAEGDIDSPGWRQIESKLGQAATQIDGAAGKLSAATLDGFRAQLDALTTKFAANDRAEKAEENENWMKRLVRDAEQHVDWPDRIGELLAKVTDTLESERMQSTLPADRIAFYRSEVTRIGNLAGGNERQKALDEANENLSEFESKISDDMFEGLSEYEAGKRWGDTEIPQNRAGYALDRLAADDAEGKAIRAKLEAVAGRRKKAYDATRLAAVLKRVTQHWEEAIAKVTGYESETQNTSADALGEEFFPATRRAVSAIRDAISGSNLHSPIPDARTEYANEAVVQKIVSDGERMLETAYAKMGSAFDAIMDAAEQLPTPMIEFDRRKAQSMAQTAREAFEGTSHADARADRATALHNYWEDTLALAGALTAAYYEKTSDEAAAKWPAIASAVDAHDGFDPKDPKWRGKVVRVNGLYNRMRWDFTGAYHMATWVNSIPVAADFEPHILDAYNTAEKHGRTAIDDHQKWDAIMRVEGTGTLKQRTKTKITKDGKTLGEIEEWLPVDCVTCKVIALRAGPVAIGPA